MTKEISPTFCPYPWTHLHAWPEGKAMLCCVAHGGENGGEVGDFSKNSYAEIMNSDKMKQVRVDMLAGKKLPQCYPCYQHEDLGVESYRQRVIKDHEDQIGDLLANTLEDGSLARFYMSHMDYRFSNLCNLGCKTCGSPLSSTIANSVADQNEINWLRQKGVLSERETITSFIYKRPEFMEVDVFPYINENLRSFYFAGGEPLIMPEHSMILDYLLETKQFDKQICYSTNLTTLRWKGKDFLEIWKNFNRILWIGSIDGIYDKLQYIRRGSKHDTVFANLDKLIEMKELHSEKQYRVSICYTHSIYNAYDTGEFIKFLDENGYLDKLDDVIINYAYSDINSVAMLPDYAKLELKQKRHSDMNTPWMQKFFSKFQGTENAFKQIDALIDTQIDQNTIHHFKQYQSLTYDKFSTSFPWLSGVLDRLEK